MACSSDSKSLLAVLTFSVSSSGLLLVNKLCLKEVALPSFLAVLQFIASVLCAVGMSAAGAADLDPLEWPRVRIYLFYIALFATAIYSNLQALTHSNVETLIVFRACGPLLVGVLKWRLLGCALPSRWSAVALSGIFACAAGYVASDNAFAMHGLRAYTWCDLLRLPPPPSTGPLAEASARCCRCGVYFVSICLSDTCGKQIISGLRWRTMWGPVSQRTRKPSLPTPALLATPGIASGRCHWHFSCCDHSMRGAEHANPLCPSALRSSHTFGSALSSLAGALHQPSRLACHARSRRCRRRGALRPA